MRLILLTLLAILVTTEARAKTRTLPYSTRTRDYSGWSGTVRGDIRDIGMAGAVIGLGDTWLASTLNPAGPAMTLQSSAAQLYSNEIRDGNLQDLEEPIRTGNFGILANPYPWGFSLGIWTPQTEGARYILPATGREALVQVNTREFRVSAARVFLDDKLSVGLAVGVAQAQRELNFAKDPSLDQYESNTGFTGTLGVLWQPEKRFLLGASLSPPLLLGEESAATRSSPALPGFFRAVRKPPLFGLGASIIPNRNLRLAASLQIAGISPNAALLSDQETAVGQALSFHPALGGFYRIWERKNLEVNVLAGTYLEPSRTEDRAIRLHGTFGLEFNPWIFNIGLGFDSAPRYLNAIASVGVDVVRAFRAWKVIPKDSRAPAPAGFLPPPFQHSDQGLPRPLVRDWDGGGTPEEILEIGKKIPGKLKKRLEETSEDVREFIEEGIDRLDPRR